MNGVKASLAEAIKVKDGLPALGGAVDVMICTPSTLLMVLSDVLKGSAVGVGGDAAEPNGCRAVVRWCDGAEHVTSAATVVADSSWFAALPDV